MAQDSSINIERTYHSSVAKIWEALTDVSKMRDWYFDIPDFRLEQGASFRFFESGTARRFAHYGVILHIDAMKELCHSWSYPEQSKGESILTWQLIPRGSATIVRLQHKGLDSFADAGEDFSMAKFRKGWEDILGRSLATYLEP